MQNKFRVLICGGRTELNYETVSCYITYLFSKLKIKQAEIVSGGCRGADKLGEQFAEDNGLEIKQFLPEWKKFGKAAGIKRNAEMISYIRQFPCAAVIAFWDLQSKGTKFTVEQARKYNIPVYIIEYGSRGIPENAASGDSGDSADCGITLVNTKIHSHQVLQNIYFYEYRIDKKADRSARALKNAKKRGDGGCKASLIERAVNDFAATVNSEADYIIYAESASGLNDYTVNLLADKLKASPVKAEKQPDSDSLIIKEKAVFQAPGIIIVNDAAAGSAQLTSLLSMLKAEEYSGEVFVFSFTD